MTNPLEMPIHTENKPADLSLEGLGNAVGTTIRDLKFRLQSLGIKLPLDSAEEVAGRPIEVINARAGGLVDELDRDTVEGLKRGLTGVSTLLHEAKAPDDVLKGFEKQSDKLVDKVADAREKNIKSYLKLRELRQNEDLTDSQKTELRKFFDRQVEVSRLLKQPNLENHLERLLSHVEGITADLEKERNTPLKSLSDEEVGQIMRSLNNNASGYVFTAEYVRSSHVSRHERRLELIEFQLAELKNIKNEVEKYKISKNVAKAA